MNITLDEYKLWIMKVYAVTGNAPFKEKNKYWRNSNLRPNNEINVIGDINSGEGSKGMDKILGEKVRGTLNNHGIWFIELFDKNKLSILNQNFPQNSINRFTLIFSFEAFVIIHIN